MGIRDLWERRALLAGFGAVAAGAALSATTQSAPSTTPFRPARHPEDEWLDRIPGKHRVVVDATTPDGAREAAQFVSNIFRGNEAGYGLDDGDVAVVFGLRHWASAFAFNDEIWAKHGAAIAEGAHYTDPQSTAPPTANPINRGTRRPLEALAKRGVHFAICNLSTRRISREITRGGGDAEAAYKLLLASAVPNAHFVPAGVVGVTRAQEYGYSMLYVG